MSQITFDEETARGLVRMYMTPDVVGQRARFVQLTGVRPGEHVLDVGIGPGLLCADMAPIVGEQGRIAGVDQSAAMISVARERCADFGWTDFRESDATELPFEDASFDLVTSTQVYEYVPDMAAALSEVRRVLKPGGRVWILDTDWDSVTWATDDRARMRQVMDAWDGHLFDPHLPSTLGAKLETAGLRVTGVEVIPLVNTSLHGHCYSGGILGAIQGYVASQTDLSTEVAQAWADEQRARSARGEYFFSINRTCFGAVRL